MKQIWTTNVFSVPPVSQWWINSCYTNMKNAFLCNIDHSIFRTVRPDAPKLTRIYRNAKSEPFTSASLSPLLSKMLQGEKKKKAFVFGTGGHWGASALGRAERIKVMGPFFSVTRVSSENGSHLLGERLLTGSCGFNCGAKSVKTEVKDTSQWDQMAYFLFPSAFNRGSLSVQCCKFPWTEIPCRFHPQLPGEILGAKKWCKWG